MAFLLHDARHLERPARSMAGPERERARRRLWRSDLLAAGAVASVAVAAGLFLAEGGANRFGDVGSALTSLGIVAGLVATDLVLVMLLLAARVPLIERAVGHDAAMALHGRLGKPVVYLLVAHGVLLLTGYAVADGVDLVAEAVAIWSLPDLPLALLGFGLFALVVVTSLVAVRRRLRYETWRPASRPFGTAWASRPSSRSARAARPSPSRCGAPTSSACAPREGSSSSGGSSPAGSGGRRIRTRCRPRRAAARCASPCARSGRDPRASRASGPARASRSRARTASSARRRAAGRASRSSRPASASRPCGRCSRRRRSVRARRRSSSARPSPLPGGCSTSSESSARRAARPSSRSRVHAGAAG